MNILTYFNAMQPYIQGRSIYQLFPSEFVENVPFARFPPFHCIRCGGQMTPDMIMPPGRVTPRAICPTCWEQLTEELTEYCWVCGEELDDHQLFRQEASPKDIHHRIHDVGKCRDYFSLVSARAIGHSTGIVEENHFLDMQENDHVMVVHDDYGSRRTPLKPATPAITYEPRETFDDWINPSGGTREKEKVNIVRLNKNDKDIWE
jgi:hypothetical protein